MRGCMLFVAGLAIGLMVHTTSAQNMTPNRGLIGLNHVGVQVPNLDEALTYYTKTLGFPEAFRSLDEKGQPRLVYIHISRNTFIELQPGKPGVPATINHLGIQVEKTAASARPRRCFPISRIPTCSGSNWQSWCPSRSTTRRSRSGTDVTRRRQVRTPEKRRATPASFYFRGRLFRRRAP